MTPPSQPIHPMLANILALANLAEWQKSVDLAEESLASWGHHSFQRVYLVGHGSSLYNSMVGEAILEHIAALPSKALPAFAFTTYTETSLLNKDTLVVGISMTGATRSTCAALERAHAQGAATLAITAYADSPLAQVADQVILTGAEDDTPLVKTKSYVQALIPLYLLALHLRGEASLRLYWLQQIQSAAEGAAYLLEHQRGEIESLAREFAPRSPMIFVLGSGPNWGTAEEASLKIIEMAKMYSECQELEDFFHGRLREVDAFTPFFFLVPQGRASRRLLDFLTVCERIGIPTIVLTEEATPPIRRLARHVLLLRGGLDEYATPLLYAIPMHLFSYHLAVLRGYDPEALRYGIDAPTVRYEGDT